MDFQELIFEKGNGLAIVTINRPKRLNALTENLTLNEIPRVMEIIRKDDEVKVMILTGAGDSFCSGVDLNEVLQANANDKGNKRPRHESLLPIGSVGLEFRKLHKPALAAVNGIAAGAGVALSLLCDIRIASEKARFSLAFVKRGLVPDCGTSYLLPRMVGVGKALELMWTGDMIDAQEALRIGLVSRVTPHHELMKMTKEFATKLAEGPSVAIELTKIAVYRGITNDYEGQLYFESYAQNLCTSTDDFKEGINSFLEKRKPHFKGM